VDESIGRRLRFAATSQVAIDSAMHRMRLNDIPYRLRRAPHIAANLLYDSSEWLRNGFRLDRPGQIHLAALEVPGRLPQPPTHRGYWYDRERHACVGMHLGLDLIRHQDRYYLIEANLGAALRRHRRALYDSRLDPSLIELLKVAEQHDFKRIVLLSAGWAPAYLDEFAFAQRESGIEVIGASSPLTHPETPQPVFGLPEELQENTIYVVFSGQGTPLSLFIHNKFWSGQWLQDVISEDPSAAKLLTYTPTYSRITLPPEPLDPRWPNLVIKLASEDAGLFVLLGRFRSEAHVREELGLDRDRSIPGAFKLGFKERLIDRLFPRLQTIFQPYITPELADGKVRKARLHLFVSPLVDQFLSAHNTIGREPIPKICPEGLIPDHHPYIASFSSAESHYVRCGDMEEKDLRQVSRDYGRLAKMAIGRKFEIAAQ